MAAAGNSYRRLALTPENFPNIFTNISASSIRRLQDGSRITDPRQFINNRYYFKLTDDNVLYITYICKKNTITGIVAFADVWVREVPDDVEFGDITDYAGRFDWRRTEGVEAQGIEFLYSNVTTALPEHGLPHFPIYLDITLDNALTGEIGGTLDPNSVELMECAVGHSHPTSIITKIKRRFFGRGGARKTYRRKTTRRRKSRKVRR